MDDIKLVDKNEKQLETNIDDKDSQDIGMKFGKEKCDMLIITSGKRQITEGIELPNQERNQRKRNLQYLGILEVETFKQEEKKEKIFLKNCISGEREKIYGKNLNKGINTGAIPRVRHTGPDFEILLAWSIQSSTNLFGRWKLFF